MVKDFNAYVLRSKTLIYKEDGKQYKHFELIKKLYENYPKRIENELINLEKLTDSKIENIVNKIPDYIITEKHKEYIIRYIKIRKQILLNIIGGGSENIKNNKDILEINDNLILERDYDNKYDENAIKIISKKNGNIYHLGYVPRYYAKELSKMIEEKVKYSA